MIWNTSCLHILIFCQIAIARQTVKLILCHGVIVETASHPKDIMLRIRPDTIQTDIFQPLQSMNILFMRFQSNYQHISWAGHTNIQQAVGFSQ